MHPEKDGWARDFWLDSEETLTERLSETTETTSPAFATYTSDDAHKQQMLRCWDVDLMLTLEKQFYYKLHR